MAAGSSAAAAAADEPDSLLVRLVHALPGTEAVSLRLPASATVADVRRAAAAELAIPLLGQQLLHEGQRLSHTTPLQALERSGDGAAAVLELGLLRVPLGALRGCATGGEDGSISLWDLNGGGSGSQVKQLASWGNSITCMAADWDAGRLLSGTADGDLILWDLADGSAPLRQLRGHTDSVTAVAMDWPRRRCLSSDGDRLVALWDLEGEQAPQQLLGHTDPIRALAVDWASGRALSGGWDGDLLLWDLEGGRQIARLTTGGAVESISVDWPSGQLFVGLMSGCLQLGSLSGQELQDTGSPGYAVYGASVDWGRRRAVVLTANVCLWDIAAGQVLWEESKLKVDDVVADWAASAVLAVGHEGVHILDLEGGAVVSQAPLAGSAAPLRCCVAYGMA